jgi:hypothetical protein
MASVVITGDTSGAITLAAPSVAGTTTLTLPATTGTFITTTGGVAPGSSGNVLTSNGTAWTSAAPTSGNANYTLYTSGNNTWTAPTGVTRVKVTLIGGGGGGGGGTYVGVGVPANPGGYAGIAVGYVTVTPGTGYAANVGAGGSGGNYNSAGSSGGTSSFAGSISATGGGGGPAYAAGSASNGSGSGGNVRATSYSDTTVYRSAYGVFVGLENTTGSGQTVQTWSATSTFGAGHPGISRENAIGFGGVGGFILIEYVG